MERYLYSKAELHNKVLMRPGRLAKILNSFHLTIHNSNARKPDYRVGVHTAQGKVQEQEAFREHSSASLGVEAQIRQKFGYIKACCGPHIPP